MTVKLGIMELPATQDADRVRDYLNGTIADGGLWTALGRASDHDHTGGLQGKPISVAAIPDGSITTGKLDPAVLLPYALVDGSKPFTGQVVANADLLVRDTLYFGAKPAGTGDVFWRRLGASALRTDANVGVGVAPAAWVNTYKALQLGLGGAVVGPTDAANLFLNANAYQDGAGWKAINAGGGVTLQLGVGGTMTLFTAPTVAAGAALTFSPRLTVDQEGRVGVGATLAAWTTDYKNLQIGAGGAIYAHIGYPQIGLAANLYYPASGGTRYIANGLGCTLLLGQDGTLYFDVAPNGTAGGVATTTQRFKVDANGTIHNNPAAGALGISSVGEIQWGAGSGKLSYSGGIPYIHGQTGGYTMLGSGISGGNCISVAPATHNTTHLGWGDRGWALVHSVGGLTQDSLAEDKQNFAPLDPAACAQAVLETDWLSFEYKPPAEQTPPVRSDEMSDEEWTEAQERYAAHMESAALARKQRGYALGSPDFRVHDLFGMADRKSAGTQSDLATVACALQDALKRIAALEGTAA